MASSSVRKPIKPNCRLLPSLVREKTNFISNSQLIASNYSEFPRDVDNIIEGNRSNCYNNLDNNELVYEDRYSNYNMMYFENNDFLIDNQNVIEDIEIKSLNEGLENYVYNEERENSNLMESRIVDSIPYEHRGNHNTSDDHVTDYIIIQTTKLLKLTFKNLHTQGGRSPHALENSTYIT